MQTRLYRLNRTEKKELNFYPALMNGQKINDMKTGHLVKRSSQQIEFVKFGTLISKTDSYKPISTKNKIDLRLDIMKDV